MGIFANKSKVEYLAVGLGNPGSSYEKTRHNTGFIVLDNIAKRLGVSFKESKKHNSQIAQCEIAGARVMLVKPLTYMNNSGEAVASVAGFYKIPAEKIIVIHDDVSMQIGKMRLRTKGSDGGHNGIKSILLHIGDGFCRIKVGVGDRPDARYDLADWVLSKFSKEDAEIIDFDSEKVYNVISLFVKGETDKASGECGKQIQIKNIESD